MRNKNILITGGAGFIGNAVADRLSKKGYVVSVGDTTRRLENYVIPVSNVDYLEFDWLDPDDLPCFDRFDVILHLAWSSNPISSMHNIGHDADDNILGTIRLLEKINKNTVGKLIFMSSGGTIYGNTGAFRVTEENLPKPISGYGVSKLACENYVEIFGGIKQYTPCILRLGNPYGAYQLQGTPVGAIASFVRHAMEKNIISVRGNGDAIRDYIHVDDLTNYVERVVSSGTIQGTYNVASGTGVSLSQILELIERLSGEKVEVEYSKAPSADVKAIVLDCEKLSSEVNFGTEISLESGIQQLIDVYRSTEIFKGTRKVVTGTGL